MTTATHNKKPAFPYVTFNTSNLQYSLFQQIGEVFVNTTICEEFVGRLNNAAKKEHGDEFKPFMGKITNYENNQSADSHIVYFAISGFDKF